MTRRKRWPLKLKWGQLMPFGTGSTMVNWVRLATIPFALAQFVCAAEPQYNPDVGTWQAVAVPAFSDFTASTAWSHAANRSPYEWTVFIKDSKVCANRRPEDDVGSNQRSRLHTACRGPEGRSCDRSRCGWLSRGLQRGGMGSRAILVLPGRQMQLQSIRASGRRLRGCLGNDLRD